MEKENHKNNEGKQEEPPGGLLLNIGKTVFLIVVLVVAWFILEKVIGK